jgi:Rps23 Pro-64 3,4-dihydroxylase Tpa1-like proline 4-hydroxylase|tara:strand:- start:432 stop:1007 length:576 start_codon:yes stop_codon:yes gene_type:complete
MHIFANVDDCALIINDFLPLDLFQKIVNFKYDASFDSHLKWEKYLYQDNQDITTMKNIKFSNKLGFIEKEKIKTIDPIFEDFLQIIIKCSFIPYQKKSSLVCSYYEYDKFSGINWHNDGDYTLNYSFYIHDEWNENWGGETLINTGRGLPLSTSPNPNSLLAIKNGVKHKVNCVIGPKKRKVIQVRGMFYE